ncbi:hypothetical protein [Lentzea nigeriaca]|uniref:hypothetical protein n=1 Tax=Lentzea nigeriaca TaxID=1128665 RepID=UPI001958B41C|nr:hypothetical protein [Lentzea nigeriaca]MBM7858445.1 hypothetical protein [Lentzea nigeriaca]
MEQVYGLSSLFAFRAQLQPGRRAPIANAVSRAHLPHITPRRGFRLAAKMISRA